MQQSLKIVLKIIGLVLLLIGLYFLETIIFWMIFGEGAQASNIMDKTTTQVIMYTVPLLIVSGIGFIIFRKKTNA